MVKGEEEDSAAFFYHWRELPQLPFLSRLKICKNGISFVLKKYIYIVVAAPVNDNIYALHIDE